MLLRIPIEGLVLVGVCLLLPARVRTIVAAVIGVLLGLLVIAKVLDMGFYDELDRPFNPVSDWGLLKPAASVFRDTYGSGWTRAVEIIAIVLAVAVVILLPLALVRVTRVAARHRTNSARVITALTAAWVLFAAFDVQLDAGAPIASATAAGLAYQQIDEAHAALTDRSTFAGLLHQKDQYRLTPGSDLLSGLRGKDVIVAFVESYGKVAVQDSDISGPIDAELNSGTQELDQAGFASRSAFLTSPTFGGISWLAHSTLQSGLWVNSQQRYDQLVGSNRFTLSDAFKRAGWRTVGDVPSNQGAWPQGTSFYHYDQLYNANNVGYAGPRFTYATMPDQYILSAFQQRELASAEPPPGDGRDRSRVLAHAVGAAAAPRAVEPGRRRFGLRRHAGRGPEPAPDPRRLDRGHGRVRPVDPVLAEQPHLVRQDVPRQQPRAGDARRSPARDDRQRIRVEPRRPDLDRRPRPGGAGRHLVVGLEPGPAAETGRAGVADGRLP